jgi:nicotinate phosphoribosyltransferase
MLRPTPVYGLPVSKIRSGWYSDKYFVRSQQVLEKEGLHPEVVMQVFCKKDALLCGVDEAVDCLRRGSARPRSLKVYALSDGASIQPWETVMRIVGDYSAFAHLETIYLGILARRTSLATAGRRVVDAAGGKPVFFFSARFDHYLLQPGDGYAARMGGVQGVSTDADTAWLKGEKAFGTIPHGLIAAYGGDTVKATLAFDRHMPDSIKRIVLVDFENDCVATSRAVAHALGKRLWGVRLDTSREIRDRSVRGRGRGAYGVSAQLVRNVRLALNREGYRRVRIIVSGGFNAQRIRDFVLRRVPFDGVGVGSALLHEKVEFTADIVKANGRPCAKAGRCYRENRRLRRVG